MLKEILIKSNSRNELIDFTEQLKKIVAESKVKDGACIVYCPHTTAAITINENADESVKQDILEVLSKLVPRSDSYSHAEGNSDAHIKSAIVGNSRTILVQKGKLVLGAWEACYFAEFDGPRSRKVLMKIIKE